MSDLFMTNGVCEVGPGGVETRHGEERNRSEGKEEAAMGVRRGLAIIPKAAAAAAAAAAADDCPPATSATLLHATLLLAAPVLTTH